MRADRAIDAAWGGVSHTDGERAAPDPGGAGVHVHHVLRSCVEEKVSSVTPVQAMIYESVHGPRGPAAAGEHSGSFDL